MKKSDLVAQVAEKAELSKAAATRAIHALFDGTTGAIAQAVRAGEQVTIPGFGRFRPKTRKARKGRNPQTGAEIDIPERNTVQFSVGRDLRSAAAVNVITTSDPGPVSEAVLADQVAAGFADGFDHWLKALSQGVFVDLQEHHALAGSARAHADEILAARALRQRC